MGRAAQHERRRSEGGARRRRGIARTVGQRVRRDERDRDRSARDGHPGHGVAQPARAAALVLHAGAAVRHPEEGAAEECTGGDEEAGQRLLRFGDDGNFALQCLAGPPQQRLDGSDLDALMVRDLLVGPPRALAHGEHVSVARRQAVESAVDELAVDRGQDELLGRVLTSDPDRMLRGQFQVVGRRAPRAAAQHVGADVPRDHRQPRVETPFAGEARQRFPRGRRTLLVPRPRPRGDRSAGGDRSGGAARSSGRRGCRTLRSHPPGSVSTSARSRSRSTSSQRLVNSSWRSANPLYLPLRSASSRRR